MPCREIVALARILLAAGAFALAAPTAAEPAGLPELRTAHDPALQRGLERVVRDLNLEAAVSGGRLALALVDVSRGAPPRLAMLNGDAMIYAASLPKIAILPGALAESERGAFALGAPRLAAIHNMIRVSSNEDATRVLVEYGDRRCVIVGLAQHADGGEWLARLAASLLDLVVPPAQAAQLAR